MMLGDAGADVIKVEGPGGDATRYWGPPFWDDEGAEFLATNRNKRSIQLDLKSAAGKQVFFDLCRNADVVVENYRRGVPERLGIDYETVRKLNPKLIYCSISGYGSTGPRRDQAAYDTIMQAFVGVMHMTGSAGSPPTRASVSVSDISAGMYANQAILLALLARASTGRGQLVEASLFESQIAWLLFRAVGYFATGMAPKGKNGSASAHIVPYEAYETSDSHIVVGALNDRLFQRLVAAMGLEELAHDARFVTNKDRVAHREELNSLLRARFLMDTTEHWGAVMTAAGLPNSPVNTVEDVLNDPQVSARDMIMTMAHPRLGEIRMPGVPIKLSETPAGAHLPPPLLSQHSREILSELGYSADDIKSLFEDKIVGEPPSDAGDQHVAAMSARPA
jgi:crotonobetainyl-CoA:carnitine CoA-transferase CaiB-like acyl-CoA transferase